MNKFLLNCPPKQVLILTFVLSTVFLFVSAQMPIETPGTKIRDTAHIVSAQKTNATTVKVLLSNDESIILDFYGENIFRLFQDNSGDSMRPPEATPPAKILVQNARRPVSTLDVEDNGNSITISTDRVSVQLDKLLRSIKILDKQSKTIVLETIAPVAFEKRRVVMELKENPQEYFYGGGVQNGRFSHKGKVICIENQNNWTDGGVASPTPFYWSTNGYGFMWYTFKKGKYDFGAKEKGTVILSHETNYLDVFFMVDNAGPSILKDFFQLTGNPVLLPKFGFYEGHLNAYNRDYWKKDSTGGMLFEDGSRYKEDQKDNGGIKESLNGEKNNYQFSARAVIDRYKSHDMPLGWILPNDGYGAGYGQASTLDSNIQNLKSFGDYARENGVQIGLWTQSDLHPKDGIDALLQRDIIKEVRDAGVRVVKTDVAWVGDGYSFGLNGVADVAQIIPEYGNKARPFIISLDGWAGSQRYAAVWSGDQTGGVWEYIRFHIPTYIGSGLSGQPNITSDMDGIFGGGNSTVNTRDFQWKTFTPMQLNMDGWGKNEKYPHALGEPAASINRTYLKLKSELIPYTYSIAKEAVNGLPLMRAMFLEYPNPYTLGSATQYQYLYGRYFLIAPIYQDTKSDEKGNDIRNGIYLPDGNWIDYFSGDEYEGNRIINNFDAPIWKLPVFVKNGAIIPMANPSNNVSEINKSLRIYEIYPFGKSSFTEYDDDGFTEAYKAGLGVQTVIESEVIEDEATITVHPAKGSFDGFVKNKATEFRINVTQKPIGIMAKEGNKRIKLREASSKDDFLKTENAYFFDKAPNLNEFATKGSGFEKVDMIKNPQLLVKLSATDITTNAITLTIKGFRFTPTDKFRISTGTLAAPLNAYIADSNIQAYSLKPSWSKMTRADYYEIDFNGHLYSTITDTSLLFDGLTTETDYTFKLRAVNKSGSSGWVKFSAKTKSNPLEFAIKGITGETTVPDQDGSEISNLFDFDESSMWHTQWGKKATPFELIMDLHSLDQLDKLRYLPRTRGNGILLKGNVYSSVDKSNWTEAGSFEWAANGDVKEFNFTSHPISRFIRISVSHGVGGFGSGREIYVFKVPGSESYIPGDINNDHLVDENDLTSYINYTGLRQGDGDFEGYISKGDLNKNGLIDAYDISNVATQLEGGADENNTDTLTGKLVITTQKQTYNKDEIVEIMVRGESLKSVNALSFALPYNAQDFEFIRVEPINMKEMDNFTNDRLHSNGKKSLYPTFVNIGNKPALEGSQDLFIIKLKAKRKVDFNLQPIDGILVDRHLNTVAFSQSNNKPFLIPALREWHGGQGNYALTPSSRIIVATTHKIDLQKIAVILKREIKEITGFDLTIANGKLKKGDIFLTPEEHDTSIGEEGYYLYIDDHITINALKYQGLFWGTRTLLQLLENKTSIPKGIARDYPEFKVRGFVLDDGRKFFSLQFLRDYVKFMSYYKMNDFQIHLNDNGFKKYFGDNWDSTYSAFRLENTTYPGLTAKDGSYSKAEFIELQQLANDYAVRIVPEIDVPAHALAFTKAVPQIGSKIYGMDHLDLHNPLTYTVVENILKEYLGGDHPVFTGKEIHIGTDEYAKNDAEAFRAFTDHFIKYVQGFGKNVRIWGALTHAAGTTPVTAKNVTMNTWYNGYANPVEMKKLGYNQISTPDGWLYIVPAAGYYYDYLDCKNIYENWTPSMIGDVRFPPGDPTIIGGSFAEWNDIVGNGISEKDVHDRVFPAMQVLAEKMWDGSDTLTGFDEFELAGKQVGEGPSLNMRGRISKADTPLVASFTFDKNDSRMQLHQVIYAKGIKGQALSFSGINSWAILPYKEIGYDYTISFWINPAHNPFANVVIFKSPNSIVKLKQGNTGKLGFSRDGYNFDFDDTVPENAWTHVVISGTNKGTSLYINGRIQKKLYDDWIQFTDKEKTKMRRMETLFFPLQEMGGFNGKLDELQIWSKALSDQEIANLTY